MAAKDQIWLRIKTTLKVFVFALLIYNLLSFLSPYLHLVGFAREDSHQPQVQLVEKEALPGHWLKTEEDLEDRLSAKKRQSEQPAHEPKLAGDLPPLQVKPGSVDLPPISEELSLSEELLERKNPEDVVLSHNNRLLNNTNVLFYWTDGPLLKAVTLLSINPEGGKGAVIAIPLITKVEDAGQAKTIAQLFASKGRSGITQYLERQMEIAVQSYVVIDQQTFERLSATIGPVEIANEEVTVAQVFEQTRSGARRDDTQVVRAVVSKVIRPEMVFKIPQMLWLITKEIDTNLGPKEIMTLYQLTQNTDVNKLTKIALPGEKRLENGQPYRYVPEQVWKNILWEMTR